MKHRSSVGSCWSLLVALLWLVVCNNGNGGAPVFVGASTSSSLLKHAVKSSPASATTAGARLQVPMARVATQTQQAAAKSLRFSRAFVRTSPIGNTGFRQFSQRATRLQTRLQKSFSLRAILSDVITNHPGTASTTGKGSTKGVNELHAQPHDIPTSLLNKRPFRLHDIQRIATGTIQESWSGFVGGYLLATTGDVTKRVYSQVASSVMRRAPAATTSVATTATISQVLPYPSWLFLSQQTLQMHARSLQFGLEWAQMSAVFGASRLFVQSIRRKEDEWNTVVGSALAGSVFACLNSNKPALTRSVPPIAMARGALLYGGTMFLLHPSVWKEGMHKLQLMPPQEVVTTDDDDNANQQSQPPTLLTATRFRNQPMEWWDGGI